MTTKHASNPDTRQVALARWATFLLILFMTLVPFLKVYDTGGSFIHFIREWLFVPMAAYIVIQFLETLNRDFTDASGFLADNGLAIIAVFVGVMTFVLMVFRVPFYGLTWDQSHIMFQATVWASIDLMFGLLFSFRIAGSGKERDETRGGP